MMEFNKTSIIILTFNRLELTQNCLASILQYTDIPYEIIIVDNHSTDGTTEWLKAQKNIKYLLNEENLGFPKGCNQGIKMAEIGNDILLLNNDVIVTKNWLKNLQTALHSQNDVGAVSCVTNSCSYYQTINAPFQTMDDMQSFAEGYNVSNPDKWDERVKLVGFCMLIKRHVQNETGLLDEIFTPGNYEDDDYSYRIRLMGYRLLLCSDTFIYHEGHGTFKDNAGAFNALLDINAKKFKEKWGFSSAYSNIIRIDILPFIKKGQRDTFSVLDVGCGCGGTLLEIKNRFKNAKLFGIEIESVPAQITSFFADVLSCDFEQAQLPYPREYFDYIILSDVLEHLRDPWNAIKNLKNYLSPDGFFLVSLPNVMHYTVILNLINGLWNYEDAGLLDRTHLRFFTWNSIQDMFQKAECPISEAMTVNNTNADTPAYLQILKSISPNVPEYQYIAYQYIFAARKNETTSD